MPTKKYTKKYKNINKLIVKKQSKQTKQTKQTGQSGGGGGAVGAAAGGDDLDLQSLSQQDIEGLMQQGILPEQLIELAQQTGQPVPPILMQMMGAEGAMPPGGVGMADSGVAVPSKTSKLPAMMDLPAYANYKKLKKMENESKSKMKPGAHKPNVFGYLFSDLISEEMLRDIKKTQGGFLLGVNLNNLLDYYRNLIASKNDKNKKENIAKIKDSQEIFKRLGEYINVDFEKILDKKMGFRNGSEIPLLPEKELNDYSSFYEILQESKKYADKGFHGKITPLGLLTMTRMMYKYRTNNAQWLRVATVSELVYYYLGDRQSRDSFFKNDEEIPVFSLLELEEFYNTDHIFMTPDELAEFKKKLTFYKYDTKINIKGKIKELKSKAPPII